MCISKEDAAQFIIISSSVDFPLSSIPIADPIHIFSEESGGEE